MLRWLILSALVLKLGPGAVDIVAHHAARAAIGLAALLLIAGLWWWLKRRRQKPAVS
jgi:hypothetical protein